MYSKQTYLELMYLLEEHQWEICWVFKGAPNLQGEAHDKGNVDKLRK